MLFDGVRNSDVDNVGSNITIICFNYDRCIEMYLEHAIVNAFRDVPADRARQIVARINIIHPYGSLGNLKSIPLAAMFPKNKANERQYRYVVRVAGE